MLAAEDAGQDELLDAVISDEEQDSAKEQDPDSVEPADEESKKKKKKKRIKYKAKKLVFNISETKY